MELGGGVGLNLLWICRDFRLIPLLTSLPVSAIPLPTVKSMVATNSDVYSAPTSTQSAFRVSSMFFNQLKKKAQGKT